MKLLSALFAAILLLALVLGYALNVMPMLTLFGKSAAAIAMVGLAMTRYADTGDDSISLFELQHDELVPDVACAQAA